MQLSYVKSIDTSPSNDSSSLLQVSHWDASTIIIPVCYIKIILHYILHKGNVTLYEDDATLL